MLASKYADPPTEDSPVSPVTPASPTESKPLPPIPGGGDLMASKYAEPEAVPTEESAETNAQSDPVASGNPSTLSIPKNEASWPTLSADDLMTSPHSPVVETFPPVADPVKTDFRQQEVQDNKITEPLTTAVDAPEKPLSPPIQDSIPSTRTPDVSSVSMLAPPKTFTPDTPNRVLSPSQSSRIVKKKVSKRGKACVVRIPNDEAINRPNWMPLTIDEFKSRLDQFEQEGFDTRGFGRWRTSDDTEAADTEAEARPQFPDPADVQAEQRAEKTNKSFSVAVPDMRVWDAYVNDLTEQKLKALGVSLGDDEQEPDPNTSRKTSSSYPNLAMSPPVPSSSATSQPLWHSGHPFSAPFSPAASTNNTSIGAIASPALSLGNQGRPGHLSRQSTYGFPAPLGPGTPNFQAAWSPQAAFNAQGFSRGASPALVGGMRALSSELSRMSPDAMTDRQPTPKGQESLSRPPLQPQPSSNYSKPVSPIKEDSRPNTSDSYGELAYPTPRGHRQNISVNLEREAEKDSIQYYPGEYIEETKHDSPSPDKEASSGSFSVPQHVSHQSKASVASNSSASKLNVAAKEFKFDPKSFHARNFSFGKNTFAPNPSVGVKDLSKPSVSYVTAHAGSDATGGLDFNAQAQPFNPPKQDFAFSSKGFNFAAEKSRAEEGVPSEKLSAAPPTSDAPKIFSGINMADIVKPTKKSKAIPIVNPATIQKESEDDEEDEDGRAKQDDARRKRGRKDATDGDEVPLFAEPTPEPPERTPEPAKPTPEATEPTPESVADKALEPPREAILEPEPEKLTEPMDYTFKKEVSDPVQPLEEKMEDVSDVPWHDFNVDSLREESRKRDIETDDVVRSITPPTFRPENSARLAPKLNDGLGSDLEDLDKPPYPDTDRDNADDPVLYPSMQELNDIMEHINKDDSPAPHGSNHSRRKSRDQPRYVPPQLRDSKPASLNIKRSPSVGSDLLSSDLHDTKNPGIPRQTPMDPASRSPVGRSPKKSPESVPEMPAQSPIRKLNTMREPVVSDWDDVVSPSEEYKFLPQANFFDTRLRGIIEDVIRQQLEPLQKSLKEADGNFKSIPATRNAFRSRSISAHEKTSSDADDEDEDDDAASMPRPRSSKADMKFDKMRGAVIEAIKSTQSHGLSQAVEQMRMRNEAETRAAELQRMLSLSEKEIALFKESSEDTESKVKSLEDQRRHAHGRIDELEDSEKALFKKVSDLTAEIAAQENTLNEYRTSSNQWRQEIDSVKEAREGLLKTIEGLRNDAEESVRVRESLNGKLEAMQEDHGRVREGLDEKLEKMREAMGDANENVNKERSLWQSRDEEQAKKHEALSVRLEEITASRNKLEQEIERLHEVERESIKVSVTLEETQRSNTRMEGEVQRLREEIVAHQKNATHFEHEASEAKRTIDAEVQRVKGLSETDVEIANKRVEGMQTELDTRVAFMRQELETTRSNAAATEARLEKALEEARSSRKEALERATEDHAKSLQGERERFEKSLADMSSQHDRVLKLALEDRQRNEVHYQESLKLSTEKISHLNDKLHHLEDKVAVAQSAAKSAATAARSASKAPTSNVQAPSDRISPQALRESIVVLQEQLQERESRIETLQQDMNKAQTDETKLQRLETEVGWLRELLGVRIDDLSELVNVLSSQEFDRISARDAAIRIRANLQMEQQEKERMMTSGSGPRGGPIPSLTDIQNFASPKAAQLAAAWGNWRRGGAPSSAGIRSVSNTGTPSKHRVLGSNASNPPAPDSANSFLSGLMTPPASNLRRTPSSSGTDKPGPLSLAPEAATAPSPGSPSASASGGRRYSKNAQGRSITPIRGRASMPPTTPPLMRKGSYDEDATMSVDEAYDENDGGAATPTVAQTAAQTSLEPFGEVLTE